MLGGKVKRTIFKMKDTVLAVADIFSEEIGHHYLKTLKVSLRNGDMYFDAVFVENMAEARALVKQALPTACREYIDEIVVEVPDEN